MKPRHALKVLRAVCFAVAVGTALWVLLVKGALERFGLLASGVLILAALGFLLATLWEEW